MRICRNVRQHLLPSSGFQVAIIVNFGQELEEDAVLGPTTAPCLVHGPQSRGNVLHTIHAGPDLHVLPQGLEYCGEHWASVDVFQRIQGHLSPGLLSTSQRGAMMTHIQYRAI